MAEIGWRLREVQKAKGYSQAEFSEVLDVGFSSLKNYMAGTRVPGVNLIVKICEDLLVSPDWLILGKGSMFYGEGADELMPMDLKHEILGLLGNLDQKKAFLGRRMLELLGDIREFNKSEEAVGMIRKGQINIDQFSEGMKRIEERELGLFALGALKAITEYLKIYTRAANNPQPVLPPSIIETVRNGAKSGPSVVKTLEGETKRLEEEWRRLTRSQ